MRVNGKKIGRNDRCPCGSGLKFKRCHGEIDRMDKIAELSQQHLNEAQARSILQQQQQGHGRPIISTLHGDWRIVAVANRIYYKKTWLTFHDFLFDYIRYVLDRKWGEAELKKEFNEMHPIIQWFELTKQQWTNSKKDSADPVSEMKSTGAMDSYLHLSYHLYLLAHNQPAGKYSEKLQKQLAKKLINRGEFPGAYYETYIFAMLIKAGFSLELLDSSGAGGKRGECIATYQKSGKKYMVEAKSIKRKDILGATKDYTNKDLRGSIRDQIYKALRKDSAHTRIIFIDVNLPASEEELLDGMPKWMREAVNATKEAEKDMRIDGKEPEPAYIFFTNRSSHHDLHGEHIGPSAISVGFKIPDYGYGVLYHRLRARYDAKIKHLDMENLMDSIESHYHAPSTFDPQLPSKAFSNTGAPDIKIGEDYWVPDNEGNEVVGTLTHAVVWETEKKVYGLFQIRDQNKCIMATIPITDQELADYKMHPDVFFGVYKKVNRKPLKNAYDVFEWLHEIYSKSPKENLLELMKNAPNIEKLRLEEQAELALIHAEHMAFQMFTQIAGNKK